MSTGPGEITPEASGAAAARSPLFPAEEILESISEAFLALDAEWRFTYVNAPAERMLRKRRQELIGRSYAELFPQFVGTELERRCRRAAREAVAVRLEHEHEDRRFDVHACPARSGGLNLYVREITDSRRVEEQLRMVAHRLTVALRNSPVVVFNQDASLRYSWIWSPQPSFCSDALGKTDLEINPGLESRRFAEAKRHVMAAGQNERQEFALLVEGVARIYDVTLEPLRGASGAVAGITGAAIDVTERKAVEEALRDANIRMRLALDAGQMATWDWNLTSGEITWSDRHYRMLGLEPSAASGAYEAWYERIHPEDREKVRREIERSREENDRYHTEYRVIWPDGSVHWQEGRGQFFYDAHGHAVRMTGVTADITERKETEASLRHRQKLESIGLLAGGIAHDFNNLLSGILGGASYALDLLPADHAAAPMLQLVVQSSERAALLTRQLLAYSGRGKFVIERVRLDELAREAADLVCASLPKSVSCLHETEPDLPAVDADPGQMQQLVMNLLINAGESIGDGSPGVIRVRTRSTEIDAETARAGFGEYQIAAGRYVELSVSDNGCGMDPETLSKIFDPFFTTKFTGRGLGLAAAQGIVRGHHGAMLVETETGRGSTFRILLPAAAARDTAQASAAGTEVTAAAAARPRGTILVVDDEQLVRNVACASLERGGYEVLLAADGAEAASRFSEHRDRISLVLLDMNMPGMTGTEILRSLRALGLDAPVLVSSGFSEMEITSRFHGLEIQGVIEKPFRAAQLIQRVREVLE